MKSQSLCKHLRLHSENGAVIQIVVILLPTLIYLVSMAVNTSFGMLVKSELQSGADASSLAGAQSLNGTQSGWVAARVAAVNTVKNMEVHTGLGETRTLGSMLSMNPSDKIIVNGHNVDRTNWESEEVIVSIMRGRMTRNDDGAPLPLSASGELTLNPPSHRFTPTEDAHSGDWQMQEENFGYPRLLVANAVQVKVSLRKVRTVLNPPAVAGSKEIAQKAVAVNAPLAPVSVAPFAIPVCSLVDDATGEFVPEQSEAEGVCYGDRYFTRLGGYDLMPEFPYRGQIVADSNSNPIDYPRCSWHNPRYFNLTDHFGVVGLPQRDVPTESEVQNVLESPSGVKANVRVGDPFMALPSGLTNSAANEAMKVRILGDGLPDEGEPSPAGSRLGLNNTDLVSHYAPGMADWDETSFDACNLEPTRTGGLCNSIRMNLTASATESCHAEFTMPTCSSGAGCEESPLWKVFVPVVADKLASRPCKGVNASSEEDPSLSGEFEIIGFIPIHIYDSDIGNEPPSRPAHCNSPVPDPSSFPWGFAPNGTPENCNLVRARIDCGVNKLYVSTVPRPLDGAFLVE